MVEWLDMGGALVVGLLAGIVFASIAFVCGDTCLKRQAMPATDARVER